MTKLQKFYSIFNLLLACFVQHLVMVANYQVHTCFGHIGVNGSYPDVTFSAFSMLRSLHSIEAIYQVRCNQGRINQHTFSAHGVSSDAFNINFCTACVKGLVNNFTQFAAVNGVSKIHREFSKINFFRTQQANFFIGNESNMNVAVVNSLVISQGFQCNHNVSNGSLVICA